MKVFQVDDDTWMAGEDGASCQAAFLRDYDGDPDTVREFGEPVELDDDDLDRIIIHDPDGDSADMTFREQLEFMQESPQISFPIFFASREI